MNNFGNLEKWIFFWKIQNARICVGRNEALEYTNN